MKVDPSVIHRLFYPQVPLLMSAAAGGRVSAMPVVSYASVSTVPPLVGVSCTPESYTCRLALRAKCFSLSVVGRREAGAMARLATTRGAKVKDKLKDAGLSHRWGRTLKVPVIDGALATLECAVESSPKIGDHLLLVGRVKRATASKAFDREWDFTNYRPILYTGWKEGLSTYPGV